MEGQLFFFVFCFPSVRTCCCFSWAVKSTSFLHRPKQYRPHLPNLFYLRLNCGAVIVQRSRSLNESSLMNSTFSLDWFTEMELEEAQVLRKQHPHTVKCISIRTKPPFSSGEPRPLTRKYWFSFQPLHSQLQTTPVHAVKVLAWRNHPDDIICKK